MTFAAPAKTNGCIHVFDMDGTLLRSTATIELARACGRLTEGLAIEQLWYEEAISDTDFWTSLLDICRDAKPVDLAAAFHNSPWMDGIAEVFADIRAHGETVIVISQSPTFFVQMLECLGAHETYGSAVELGVPVSASATLLLETKVTITQAALAARGLGADDCVVYGDSTSDLGLFTAFSRSVAVNARPSLAALAASRYSGTDIRGAYAMGRELIATDNDK